MKKFLSLALATILMASLSSCVRQPIVSSEVPLSAESDPLSGDPYPTPWGENETLADPRYLKAVASLQADKEGPEGLSVSVYPKRIEAWPNSARFNDVFVVPLDPHWSLEAARTEAAAAKEQGLAAPHYEAAVYSIQYGNRGKKTRIVIPSTLSWGREEFIFDVTTIWANACNVNGAVTYDRLKEIVIPQTITTIEEGAFPDTPEDVTIFCEAPATDGEGNPTYPEAAFTTAPEWATPITENADTRCLNVTTSVSRTFGPRKDFYIGYCDEERRLDAYLEFELEDKENGTTLLGGRQVVSVPMTGNYNAIGDSFGSYYFSFFIAPELPDGAQVKMDSIRLHGVYPALEEDGTYRPDLTTGPLEVEVRTE